MTDHESNDKAKKIKEIYRYDEMSNKVLKLDRRFLNTNQNPQRDAEISQPKSMSGKITAKDMGKDVRSGTPEKKRDLDSTVGKREKRLSSRKIQQDSTILDASSNFRLHYYPKNSSSVELYEQILQWVTEVLGNDIPHDLIVGTADVLIKMLKEDEVNGDGNFEKRKKNIQDELGIDIETSKLVELVKLTKNITDYEAESNETVERAVAILADNEEADAEEEENNSDNANVLERQIDDDEDDFEEDNVDFNSKIRINKALPNVENDIIKLSDQKRSNIEAIPIYSVDEFFLQRKLASIRAWL